MTILADTAATGRWAARSQVRRLLGLTEGFGHIEIRPLAAEARAGRRATEAALRGSEMVALLREIDAWLAELPE